MENKSEFCTGIGLIIGAAAGVLLFLFTGDAWHIGIGAGIGLLIGAILEMSYRKRV